MNTQRINISNLVRSILLIAIGIVIGISIVIGIGRIGNAPSSVSQRAAGLDRQAVGQVFAARAVVSDGRATKVRRLDVAAVDRVVEDVVDVNFDGVRGNSLLV